MFQSSVAEIRKQDFLLNCPYPIYQGDATLTGIIDTRLNYTVAYSASNTTGSFFVCTIQPNGLFSASELTKPYGATLFNSIPYGYFGYLGDSIATFGQKVQPFFYKLYLMVQAPTIVTNLSIFTYLNILLGGFIALGTFMVIRGNGG